MDIKYIKLGELQSYEANTRTHSDEQVAQLADSITEFGFTNPLLIDGERQIIAGHGRLAAATKLGMDKVPCIVLDHLTEVQRKAYVIADNKLALNAGWDEDLLKLELSALDQIGFDLSVIGFDADELSGLVIDEDIAGGLTDEDDVPEVAEIPISKQDDIWLLDNHRVMCGDSTSIDDVDKLVHGGVVDMVYTDPPYGIDYHANTEGSGTGLSATKRTLHEKIIGDGDISIAVKVVNLILNKFDKSSMVFWGANYYCQSVPNNFGWLFWDKCVDMPTFSGGEFAFTNRGIRSSVFTHKWSGMLRDSERGTTRLHPNQKPTILAEWCFKNYGEPTTILDLFLGSGSTLIAAQKTNRQCYGMELDPKYVDVIIKRWQEYTGKQAVHSVSGLTFDEVADAKQVA